MSPNQDLMAVVTAHTVHIAVLPPSEMLVGGDDDAQNPAAALKLKTHTIGPTTHVLSQPALASVLWHPFGADGNCLVTVTTDAVVRVWEFDQDNRWSSDTPAMALDIRKLAAANSEADDVAPFRSTRNQGFSADAVGMDVAAATFGGCANKAESPWSSMTLWMAMQGGEIYALCPLLPSKWQASGSAVASLSTEIVDRHLARDRNLESPFDKQIVDQQFMWAQELDNQDPVAFNGPEQYSNDLPTYRRPSRPSGIPRLQGPFLQSPEPAEELEVTDIHVVSSTTSGPADDESVSDVTDGLSVPIIAILTTDGQVYVTIAPEDVSGQWVPRKPPKIPLIPSTEPALIVLEVLDTIKPGEASFEEWPLFSYDAASLHDIYVTNSRGIYRICFSPWLDLEKELQGGAPANSQFRLTIFRDTAESLRQCVLKFERHLDADIDPAVPACLVMRDSDLGHFILTTIDSQAHAAILGDAYAVAHTSSPQSKPIDDTLAESVLELWGPMRTPYLPHAAFYRNLNVGEAMQLLIPARHRSLYREEIRLSTATLDLMTEAHRFLSTETHRLGLAASELFSRCHCLQQDLRHQIERTQEIVDQTEDLTCASDGTSNKTALEIRTSRTRRRQAVLMERVGELKRKVKGLENRPLSWREREWQREIGDLSTTILSQTEESEDHDARFRQVQKLKQDLLARMHALKSVAADSRKSQNGDIPDTVRQRRIDQVRKMLDYESFLVEAAQSKLEVLSMTALTA